MMKLVHAGDVHLSLEERDYSLQVLSGIVELARSEKASYLVLAGDVFDSFRDAESLRADFREAIAPLRDACEVLYLPGNHELLERGQKSLRALDLGIVTLLDRSPCQCLVRDGLEFLAIPHQPAYRDYRSWPIPGKGGRLRVAVAHGVVNGLSYAGVEEEAGGSALDPDLFHRFQVDYAALGHIHARREEVRQGLRIAYPGSARVWRRREYGERGVNLLSAPVGGGRAASPLAGTCGLPPAAPAIHGYRGTSPSMAPAAPLQVDFVPLAQAGQYREIALPVGFEGDIEEPRLETDRWGERDWICLVLSGIVEDENAVARLEGELQRRYARRVRRLEIRREGIAVLPGIAAQPLAERFLRQWRQVEPPADRPDARRVWLRARELGFEGIRAVMEDRP
jgi:DNA repair exonuclease SbcCD nuclease subunit